MNSLLFLSSLSVLITTSVDFVKMKLNKETVQKSQNLVIGPFGCMQSKRIVSCCRSPTAEALWESWL